MPDLIYPRLTGDIFNVNRATFRNLIPDGAFDCIVTHESRAGGRSEQILDFVKCTVSTPVASAMHDLIDDRAGGRQPFGCKLLAAIDSVAQETDEHRTHEEQAHAHDEREPRVGFEMPLIQQTDQSPPPHAGCARSVRAPISSPFGPPILERVRPRSIASAVARRANEQFAPALIGSPR